MRYTGPWSDAIVTIAADRRAAYVGHLQRLDAAGRQQRFGSLVTDAELVGLAMRDSDCCGHLIGIVVDGEIRATAHFGPLTPGGNPLHMLPAVHQAALAVEPGWRRQGMGYALLLRTISAVRSAGGRHLMIDGLACTDALRHMATLFSAEFSFLGHDCQAWFALTEYGRFPDAREGVARASSGTG